MPQLPDFPALTIYLLSKDIFLPYILSLGKWNDPGSGFVNMPTKAISEKKAS